MSSYEASSPSEPNNAFDGWYHHQIQLTAETTNAANNATNVTNANVGGGGGGHQVQQVQQARQQVQQQQHRQSASLQPQSQIIPPNNNVATLHQQHSQVVEVATAMPQQQQQQQQHHQQQQQQQQQQQHQQTQHQQPQHQQQQPAASLPIALPLPMPMLPEGWEEMRDPHSGRIYYVDHERQITTWDRPSMVGGTANSGDIHQATNNNNNIDTTTNNNNQDIVVDLGNNNDIVNHGNNNQHLYYLSNSEGKGDTTNDDSGELVTEMATTTVATTTKTTMVTPAIPTIGESFETQHHHHHHRQQQEEEKDEWDSKMKELRAFKIAKGHTNVTPLDNNLELGEFLVQQRKNYQKRMLDKSNGLESSEKNEHSYLTDDRIRELEELGFEFMYMPRDEVVDTGVGTGVGGVVVEEGSRSKQYTEKWERTIEELKAFKEVHGHMNVPQKEGSLGRWVNNQRQFYSKRTKGEKTSLTDERVKELDELGFAWALKSNRSSQSSPNKQNLNKKPRKKRKQSSGPDPRHFTDIKSKKVNTSTSDANVVSAKVLPADGSQVIDSKEKVTHADGSTVETETKEIVRKRVIRRADGTRVLETTTKIVTTKIERIVLPSPLPPEPSETDDAQKEGKEAQSTPKREELQLPPLEVPPLEVPPAQAVNVDMICEPSSIESPKGSITGKREEEEYPSIDSTSPSKNDVEEGAVIQTEEV